MKRLMILFFCLMFVCAGCTGCSKAKDIDPITSDSPAYKVCVMLTENNEMLEKYVSGSGNALISLAGLEELMNEVNRASEQAVECAKRCLALAPDCKNDELLSRYGDEIENVKLSLNTENDKMKAAKKSRDIPAIEDSLENLLAVIIDYHTLLEQFEEELR